MLAVGPWAWNLIAKLAALDFDEDCAAAARKDFSLFEALQPYGLWRPTSVTDSRLFVYLAGDANVAACRFLSRHYRINLPELAAAFRRATVNGHLVLCRWLHHTFGLLLRETVTQDLLHFAVLANQPEVCAYVLKKGTFTCAEVSAVEHSVLQTRLRAATQPACPDLDCLFDPCLDVLGTWREEVEAGERQVRRRRPRKRPRLT